MGYSVKVTPQAARDLQRLPQRVAPAVVEFIFGPLQDNPGRLGKPLRDDFEGLWSARRADYRVIYDIDEARGRIIVLRVAHRSSVYRTR